MGQSGNWLVVERFAKACQSDERVLAAFLGGSLAKGTDDAWSDLDLYVVVEEGRVDELARSASPFVVSWADPVFLHLIDDFEGLGWPMVLFVLAEGSKGELAIGTSANLLKLHGGPHKVLVDKVGALDGVSFPLLDVPPPSPPAAPDLGVESHWFWYSLFGLTTHIGRGEIWSAQEGLHRLRRRTLEVETAQAATTAGAAPFDRAELDSTFAAGTVTDLARAAAELARRWERHGFAPELARVTMARLESAGRAAG